MMLIGRLRRLRERLHHWWNDGLTTYEFDEHEAE